MTFNSHRRHNSNIIGTQRGNCIRSCNRYCRVTFPTNESIINVVIKRADASFCQIRQSFFHAFVYARFVTLLANLSLFLILAGAGQKRGPLNRFWWASASHFLPIENEICQNTVIPTFQLEISLFAASNLSRVCSRSLEHRKLTTRPDIRWVGAFSTMRFSRKFMVNSPNTLIRNSTRAIYLSSVLKEIYFGRMYTAVRISETRSSSS